jgi:pantetheine-phosphate adenylyltransferase
MKKIAVFAGSFDPFTLGHLDIVKRASALFDELWVVIFENTSKKYMYDEGTRMQMIQKAVKGLKNVKVDCAAGLTVDYMKMVKATYLVRGIRGAADVEYEQSIAWNNNVLYPECETIFLSSSPEHLNVSSTVVRELLKVGVAKGADGKKILAKYVPAAEIPLLTTNH